MPRWRDMWARMPDCAGAGAGAIGWQAQEILVPAMTRYSRSVIPGRPQEGEGGSDASLERAVFGAKKRPVAPPANDREDYPDPMEMDLDESGHLVDRNERRRPDDRRKPSGERRKASERRSSDFPPLRETGVNYRTADDGKRGPILLVGALVIVAVFGVVVWSAYRDGVKGDDPEAAAPQLATAGAFKTPPHEVKEAAVAGGQPADSLEQLDGGPSPVGETRPEPVVVAGPAAAAPAPAPTPAPSKVTATPPAPLKTPASPAPPQQAAARPAAPIQVTATALAPVAAKPANPPANPPAIPPVQLPKPTATLAAAPAPALVEASAFKPSFAAGGAWVAQIAAASSEAGAIAEWDRRAKAMPGFFSGAERFIVQADVNGKTVYRLRAGPFGSKADADAFCSAFKAKGGNCFPATK